jgi:hypothetical protein
MTSTIKSPQSFSDNLLTRVKELPSIFKRLPDLLKDSRKRWWVIVPSLNPGRYSDIGRTTR